MNKYQINIKKLALMQLPTFMRKPAITGIAYAAVSSLGYCYTQFHHFRLDCLQQLTKNGQVCYLQAILNDLFDSNDRRITITDSVQLAEQPVIWRDTNRNDPIPLRENNPGKLIYRQSMSGAYAYDFTVRIPSDLRFEIDEKRLRAVVNMYKLTSKRFNINYV
ncbi:MAG: hypothetical protein LUG98_03865 [Tannerellaceae bacterium]|nr:hypothetical protein [Tannerellaceae bacterium]